MTSLDDDGNRPWPYDRRWVISVPHPFVPRRMLMRASDVRPGETVVEIGVGTGHYTSHLLDAVGESGQVIGVDVQQVMVDHAGIGLTGACTGSYGRLQLLVGDVQDLRLADACADLVVMVSVVGELASPDRALAEMARIVRPGGRVVIGESRFGRTFVRRAKVEAAMRAAGLRVHSPYDRLIGYCARASNPD